VLFGTPDSVSADVAIQRPGSGAPDYFHLVLAYGTRRVILHSSSIVRAGGPRFQVHGSTGSYVKYGTDPQEDALRAGRGPGDAAWGKEPEPAYGRVTIEREGREVTEALETLPGTYQVFYRQMYAAIAEGAPPPVPGQHALDVIRIIECALQSSRQRQVVPFPGPTRASA
jgi:scyllo-inositol 2-dehydrogenase (NADP+)